MWDKCSGTVPSAAPPSFLVPTTHALLPQVLELPNKSEKVLSFAWEPKGHRFAIVHGDSARPSVSFYGMKDEKGKLGVKHLGAPRNTTLCTVRDGGFACVICTATDEHGRASCAARNVVNSRCAADKDVTDGPRA